MTSFIDINRLQSSPVFAKAFRELEEQDLQLRRAFIDESQRSINEHKARAIEMARQRDDLRLEIAGLRELLKAKCHEESRMSTHAARASWISIDLKRRMNEKLHAGSHREIIRFIIWARLARNQARQASSLPPFWNDRVDEKQLMQRQEKFFSSRSNLGALVDAHIARAEQMRLDAISHDDALTELSAMASAIYEAYSEIPGVPSLPADYLAA